MNIWFIEKNQTELYGNVIITSVQRTIDVNQRLLQVDELLELPMIPTTTHPNKEKIKSLGIYCRNLLQF